MSQPPLTVRRWKRVEYERLIDLGALEHDPIELIAGQLIVAEPQSAYHAAAIRAVDYALRAVLPPGWIVSIQSPISLDDESEPEPDLAVVPGRLADYRHAHPAQPALVVEVGESSVAFDRVHKGTRGCSDAGEALEEIQGHALRGEDRGKPAVDLGEHAAGLNPGVAEAWRESSASTGCQRGFRRPGRL